MLAAIVVRRVLANVTVLYCWLIREIIIIWGNSAQTTALLYAIYLFLLHLISMIVYVLLDDLNSELEKIKEGEGTS